MNLLGRTVNRDQIVVGLLLCAVLAIGISLRYDAIFDRSISQDESTMTLFALGVLEKGYPHIQQRTGEFIISTYELVPYPIAASIAVFGKSELAVRLPSLFFSSLTLLLIFYVGWRFHSVRAGLLAALTFAVLPWTIYWGSNGFYPSQLQFLSLLTMLILYKILTAKEPPARLYYAVAAAILATYITWEGSGFLLPVFFITAISLTWGRWHWLKPVHAWIAAFIIILGVFLQLTFRTVLRAPFTAMGTDRSQVSFVEPAFNSYGFNPSYYVESLMTPEHIMLFAFFLMGLFILRGRFVSSYFAMIVLVALGLLTGLLGYYALRYVYFLLPAVILVSSMAAVTFADTLLKQIYQKPVLSRAGRASAMALLTACTLLIASPIGLRLQLPGIQETSSFELVYSSKGFGFKNIMSTVRDAKQEGDVVVVQAPFPYMVYTGETGDYFLQVGTATSIYYHPTQSPYYTDKWVQNPVIRMPAELSEVMHSARRVWFVFVPDGASRTSIGDEMWGQIHAQSVVYKETADGKLLLWKNPAYGRGLAKTN
jgi:hypothetical protein